MGMWLAILAVLAAVLLGSLWLRSHGQPGLAMVFLLLLAIPALLYGAFLALILIFNPRWN